MLSERVRQLVRGLVDRLPTSRGEPTKLLLQEAPVVRSGLPLAANTVVTAGLGFIFWFVAARTYPVDLVGIGAASIAAMIMIADVCQMGLRNGLVRFLPVAGSAWLRIVCCAYLVGAAVGAATGIAFVLGTPLFATDLGLLRTTPSAAALFTVGCAAWVVFVLQDGVLIGSGLASWVPTSNGLFGAAKVGLLVPFAGAAGWLGAYGVFLAWTVPVLAIVVGLNGLLWRRHRAAAPIGVSTGDTPAMRSVFEFSLLDWVGSASRAAVIGGLPLLVLAVEGPEASAAYFLAWSISSSVYLLSAAIGEALVAETAVAENALDRNSQHGLALSLVTTAAPVAALLIVAPWLLAAFGSSYAELGTPMLRLLLVAALPNLLGRLYLARLRIRRQMARTLVFETAVSAGAFGVAWIGLRLGGLTGAGAAWLVVLSSAAVWSLSDWREPAAGHTEPSG